MGCRKSSFFSRKSLSFKKHVDHFFCPIVTTYLPILDFCGHTYRTGAIISRGLYFFLPNFHFGCQIIRQTCWKPNLLLKKLGKYLCLPLIISTDEGSGFVQAFFTQTSPTGQSVSWLHPTEMSPTSFESGCHKFGPEKHY